MGYVYRIVYSDGCTGGTAVGMKTNDIVSTARELVKTHQEQMVQENVLPSTLIRLEGESSAGKFGVNQDPQSLEQFTLYSDVQQRFIVELQKAMGDEEYATTETLWHTKRGKIYKPDVSKESTFPGVWRWAVNTWNNHPKSLPVTQIEVKFNGAREDFLFDCELGTVSKL